MTDNSSARTDETETKNPVDHVYARLSEAVAFAVQCDPAQMPGQVQKDVQGFLAALTKSVERQSVADPCGSPKKEISPLCRQRAIDLKTSEYTCKVACDTARSGFVAARDAWSAAVSGYEFAINQAELNLTSTAADEIAAYKEKANPDSRSRNQMLYQAMKQETSSALQVYQAAAQDAGNTLAAAAGTLLSAYVTFVTTLDIAQTAKLIDDSTAYQAFWGGVEGILDAP